MKIEKPWGYENLLEKNDRYVMKELFMKQGHKCSLQYHEKKHETFFVVYGKLKFTYGDDEQSLSDIIVEKGFHMAVAPMKIHRMEALEDSLYLEASTPELDDVVRLNDSYGRK